MPATISTISSSPYFFSGNPVTVTGSGFGASKGNTKTYLYRSDLGTFVEVTSFTTWSNTSLEFNLPIAPTSIIQSLFMIILEGEVVGRRSNDFAVGAIPIDLTLPPDNKLTAIDEGHGLDKNPAFGCPVGYGLFYIDGVPVVDLLNLITHAPVVTGVSVSDCHARCLGDGATTLSLRLGAAL